ncbi:MAG: lysoplasmalogenase family protein [Paracoccaceae bacterium]
MPASAFWITVTGLALALAYLPLAPRATGPLHGALKTLPLSLFAVASFVAGAPALLTMALVLSALGDLTLSRGTLSGDGRAARAYGVAAIALVHLCYILLFVAASQAPLWDAFATAPLAAIAIVALALSTEIWLAPHTGARRWPVRAYVALIAAMMLAALTFPPVTPGAAALAASDAILSLWLFRRGDASRWTVPAGRAIWMLHVAGHALILWGVLTA